MSVDSTSSSASSSYAGSKAEEPSEGIVPAEFLTDAFANALDPSTLDRAIVVQSQTSGIMHAKAQELSELMGTVNERLAAMKPIVTRGISDCRLVKKDLEAIQLAVGKLNDRARDYWPIEFVAAKEQIEGANNDR